MRSPIPESLAPQLRSVLRVVVGGLFMAHGTQKLFVFPSNEPGSPVELASWYGVAGVLETFGGALMILGLFTRPVAFVLAGEMAVAYVKVHIPMGAWPLLNSGELAALYCFAYLYFAAAGGGPWSVDAWLTARARRARGG